MNVQTLLLSFAVDRKRIEDISYNSFVFCAITDKPFSVRMPMDYVKGFNCQR